MDSTTTIEMVFEVLNNRYRRHLLVTLTQTDADAKLDPLDAVPGDDDRLSTDLAHVHLPKLDTLDVIEWHRDTNTVERGDSFSDIEPVVTVLHENRDQLPFDWL